MHLLTPIKGFTNTSVTRAICLASTVLAITLSVLDSKYLVRLTIFPALVDYKQYWRVLTYQLSVVNESDYLLTCFLWYYFKNLERFFGSRKYLSLISLFALYNSIICFLCLVVGDRVVLLLKSLSFPFTNPDYSGSIQKSSIFNEVTSGPLGILSSLYVCYGAKIPASYQFKLLLRDPLFPIANGALGRLLCAISPSEITLSNHFPVSLLFALMALNGGLGSILPCLVGCFVGKLYVSDILLGQKMWQIPEWVFPWLVHPSRSTDRFKRRILSRFSNRYQSVDQGIPPSGPGSAAVNDAGRYSLGADTSSTSLIS